MPRGRFPGGGEVIETVPMYPRSPACEQFCRAANAPVLNFFGAERGYADFCHPNRQRHERLNLGDLVRPLVDLPQIPVKRKAMHGDDVDMFENTLRLHVFYERRVDRRDAAEHPRQRWMDRVNGLSR